MKKDYTILKTTKKPLLGLNLEQLNEITDNLGLPAFNAKEIAKWIYQRKATHIDQMTNIAAKARQKLSETYCIGLKDPENVSESADGTKKYLFETARGKYIETAIIPDKDRVTICLSTQVGCKMACAFCMTAKQGYHGQLAPNEILNQLTGVEESGQITNIVYMGMGEPFDNLENVMKTLEILTSGWGFAFSPRRITVSTIGVLPAIEHFVEHSKCHLAVSLHSPFEEERASIMPVQRAYSLTEIVDYLKKANFEKQRRISFEYILFDRINDSIAHVKQLSKLLNKLRCRINLMKYHTLPNSSLKGASHDKLVWFRDELNKRGLVATIRASRGEDIDAACGLLSTLKHGSKTQKVR